MPPPVPYMGIYVDRSPEDVFAYVLDIARTPEWRPRMSGVEWITRGEPGVGSRFRVTVKSLGYSFDFELESLSGTRRATSPTAVDKVQS